MPICTNPKCGQISKAATRFCPHCGQDSLSLVDKSGFKESPNSEISMESFEAVTKLHPAREEHRRPSKKVRRSFKVTNPFKSNLRKIKSRSKNAKTFGWGLLIIVSALVALFAIAPDGIKNLISTESGLKATFSTAFNEDELQFKFLTKTDNGVPAYFAGCNSIDYYIRQNYASNADIALVTIAMDRMGNGIGRTFTYKGLTNEQSTDDLPDSILVNFTRISESKDLQESIATYGNDVAAVGGPKNAILVNSPLFGSQSATKGAISVDQTAWLNMSDREKTTALMHEAGHVLGLDHPTNGSGQIMDAVPYESEYLGTGDLLGLEILSAVAGCNDFPNYLSNSVESNGSSTPETQSATESLSPIYFENESNLANPQLRRNLLGSADNSCGNSFSQAVLDLDRVIPNSWILRESDGCGSGRDYTWSSPVDKTQKIVLGFYAATGWCSDYENRGINAVADEFSLAIDNLEKVDNPRDYFYFEEQGSDTTKGIIEVGSSEGGCEDGSTFFKYEYPNNLLGPLDFQSLIDAAREST